ncbi:MAG: LysR family transcriptional regulator [Betaproteobacteria bacterium]|nr:MAG: LysR family transcriptional regulator [Actinobacteria bacterium 13_1_20CM_3_68_10]TMH89960.1 MAG: LysR family transcriptional regulator [Betaproteobacteria bacterium]
MKNMDLTALQIFRSVVEQGGVNKAAAKLHRVPSNVTTRIKQLEEQLGAKLFSRVGRRLTLSHEGKVLLPLADQLLRLSSEAEAALRNKKPRGTLRIGALESTAASRLPPVLSRYHELYPDVQIELVTGTSGALVSRVHKQDVEAAFVAEPFNADGLETQTVFVEQLVLITPKSFGSVRSAKDIGNRTVIAFSAGCSYRQRLEAWLGASKVLPDRVMEFQSYHAIIACVAAGSGLAVVPRAVLELARAKQNVAMTALPPRIAKARTQLVWRREHHSAALEAMKNLF